MLAGDAGKSLELVDGISFGRRRYLLPLEAFLGQALLVWQVFFAAAPVMAWRLDWAPVELGFLISVLLGALAAHLRKLDREAQPNADAETMTRR